MEEPRNRYILVQDRVGHPGRSMLALGLTTKATPTQVLKGELLEALPEAEQPSDSTRIALAGIERKSLRLECRTEDINRLTSEEADLLLAISSAGLRYQTFIDRKRLDFGRRILPGSQVWVEVKGIPKKLHGVVWYKGDLPSTLGTMFGVQLIKNPGQGTTDGMFSNKRFFTCDPDSGVFVGLDKITPLEDSNATSLPKSPKRDENAQVNFTTRLKETVLPSFLKGKNDGKSLRERTDFVLKIDQRVVTFVKDVPIRGTVRFIGDEKDSSTGYVHTVVGLELDDRCGSGTGKLKGRQLFVCRKDYAAFVDIKTVIPEEDFDENAGKAAAKNTAHKQRGIVDQIHKDEILTRPMSYDQNTTTKALSKTLQKREKGKSTEKEELETNQQLQQTEERKNNMQRELMRIQQELRNCQEHLHQKESEEVRLQEQLREKESHKENLERQLMRMEERLREKDEEGKNLKRRMREIEQEKHEQHDTLQGQIREVEQQFREKEEREENLQRQLRELEQEKDKQLENLQRQLRELEQQLSEKDEREENSHRWIRELEREKDVQLENLRRQLREIEQQIREKDDREENSQRRARELEQEKGEQQESFQRQLSEMGQQLTNSQGQVREKDGEKANLEQQVTTLERQLRIKDQEVNELELSLSTAQRTISEQRRQETCDWVIPRNEIKITDKRLGKGGWGSVNEGSYCGCSVAVKQIYELILSPHNRRLFEREMNIASRCRHPCLLQFIGATNDEGSPLFVTELMETSLRALLEQRQLCETEIAIISLDVTLALNYLHQKKPSPIIHRDVSSANVLLWRQGDQWRGKVSDYGTANFMQQTMTVAPGASIYSAPEAVSSNQTAMIDVYSFGVLLCEMCIRELPDPEKREEQVLLVTNRVMRGLVRRCLQSDPTLRPNMEQIIQDLEQFNQTS